MYGLKRQEEREADADLHFRDALTQVKRPRDRQSPQVIEHRLKKLSAHQLLDLRDRIFLARVLDEQDYDRVLAHPMEPLTED